MRRPWRRRLLWLGLAGLAAVGAWGSLILFPRPCFAHRLQEGNLELCSDRPFEVEAARVRLREVARCLARIPALEPQSMRIFLCHGGWRGRLFFLASPRAIGLSYTPLAAHAFVRGGDLGTNRVQRPDGVWVEGRFTLTHVMAHELAHAVMGARTGLSFHRLPPWIKEGWAERVAGVEGYTFAQEREAFLREDAALREPPQAPYRRYHLLVSYLLDHQGWSLERLVAEAPDQARVEGWLRGAAPRP